MNTNPILIVDDDIDDRTFLKYAFDEINIKNTLLFAEDGKEMMNFLDDDHSHNGNSQNFPGLIILDLNLPGKDGKTLLKELKDNAKFKRIPIIIVSTSQRQEDMRHCYALGCDGYFPKPLSRDGFISIIQSIMGYWEQLEKMPNYSN